MEKNTKTTPNHTRQKRRALAARAPAPAVRACAGRPDATAESWLECCGELSSAGLSMSRTATGTNPIHGHIPAATTATKKYGPHRCSVLSA